MTEFLTNVDICNRSLQILGAERIDTIADDTKNAGECAFAYDKLRQSELRRNTWRFATRTAILRAIDSTTMLYVGEVWSATSFYMPGSIVADSNGQLWQTNLPFNQNRAPGTDPSWYPYFGQLTLDPYTSGTSYSYGDLVYENTGVAGIVNIFLSLANANTTDPSVITAYSNTTTYNRGDIASSGGQNYVSLIDLNLGQTIPGAISSWSSTTTYAATNTAVGLDGRVYISIGSGNIGHDPTLDTTNTYWNKNTSPQFQGWGAAAYAGTTQAVGWRYLGDGSVNSLKSIHFVFPISQTSSVYNTNRNIYRLPSGYLKTAPTDPKAGSISYLGAPSGLFATDWIYEGDFIISQSVEPLVLRFVSDYTYVPNMDVNFCEGLAARIAYELCETITQSADKKKEAAAAYKLFMGEARISNAIETGAVQPSEDDYIMCRQ